MKTINYIINSRKTLAKVVAHLYNHRKLLLSIIITVILSIIQIYSIYWLSNALQRIILEGASVSSGKALVIFIFFILSNLSLAYLTFFNMRYISKWYLRRLSFNLMSSIRNIDLEDSEVTNKYSQEVARGQITLFNNLATALVNVIMMTLIFVAMVIINAKIALSLVVMLFVIFLILFKLFRPVQRKLGDRIYQSSQEGIRLIRLLVSARKSFIYWLVAEV